MQITSPFNSTSGFRGRGLQHGEVGNVTCIGFFGTVGRFLQHSLAASDFPFVFEPLPYHTTSTMRGGWATLTFA